MTKEQNQTSRPTDKGRGNVRNILQRQTLRAGDRIFKEGDEGNMAYVVQSGEVEIFKIIDGGETVLGKVGQGGIFGEMALIDCKPRMAGARVSKGSAILVDHTRSQTK